jgi:hypothetical protein
MKVSLMKWKTDLPKSKILKPRTLTYGTLIPAEPEVDLNNLKFKVYKYNNRPRPQNKNHIVIFSCFSEFGSELLGCLYCIPRMLQNRYLGYYVIVMGWHGREYLYRHLVDEFWELDRDYHWLREYCRAFHHSSKNLRRLEKSVNKKFGKLIDANPFSIMTLTELYADIDNVKKQANWIPMPGQGAYNAVTKFLKPNSVGVTARYRKCYGRNLQIDFYKRLLDDLQTMGYDPIWIGEPNTTYECPYNHITNFRDSEESCDLEKTLALTSKLKFTIQFWTASTRLAGLVGTPFIIFESPDQIYGGTSYGHEGLRLKLCTRGRMKLVISHFKDVYNDHNLGLKLAEQAIKDIEKENYNDIISLECDKGIILNSMRTFFDSYNIKNM